MKRTLTIIFLSLLFTNFSFAQIQDDNGLRRNPLIVEQYCNQHFEYEKFQAEFSAAVNPALITDLSAEHFKDYTNHLYKKMRFKFIDAYMKGETDIVSFEPKLNDLKAKAILKTNKLFEQGKTLNMDGTPNLLSTNAFVNLIREYLIEQEHSHQNRGPGDPCVNPDFEMCNFTNWNLVQGTVPYPSPAPFSFTNPVPTTSFSTTNSSTPILVGSGYDQHYIVNGGTDAIGGFPMVYPGGTCTAAIGDFTNTNYGASQISQTFLVSAGDAILVLNYAVVLDDAGHTPAEQPYFRMRVYDGTGASIMCAEYEAVAGDGQAGWVTSGTWQYKPWTTVFIPLAPYLGQNVTVEFTVGDCAQGGHAGYAYVDASCASMSFNMTANAVCNGQPITITGPPGAASYLWNTGATTQSINTSTPGFYSVTVTPVTGSACAITLDTTVLASPNPIANFIHNAPVCTGVPVNFTDQSNPNGATIGTWAWDFGDGQTSALQSPNHAYAAPGNYNVTLTVTTTAGCIHSVTIPVTITGGTPPIINPAGPFCSTAAATNLTVNVPGGTWSATCGACINAASGQFNPALATPGNNTITYTIGGACGGVDTEVIIVESIALNSITSTDVDCFGNCNGQVTISATGATQYSINGGALQASGSFTGLCAGNYNVLAQSAIGCQVTGAIPVNQPTALTLPINSTNETCFQSCDGTASVTPGGGTTPYTLSWSNGAGNVTAINSLCTGAYTATLTDDNGCVLTANTNITGPPQLVISNIASTMESCQGACDGTITITSPLGVQFSINGGVTFQATGNFANVCSGNYNVTVEDANGCSATGVIAVSSPNPMTLTVGNDTTICIGGTATLIANVVGGTNPTTLIWDQGLPVGSPQNVSPVVNTTYSVFAQDANGCFTPPQTITVTINPPLNVIALQDASICVGATANITANASGGNGGPYTYSWNDGAGNILNGPSHTVTPLVTTVYTVTASDNCGTPVATDQVTITVNQLPVVAFVADTLQGCTPVAVNFTNNTDPALTGNCFWDFGDGTTSNNCVTSHTFTTPGCYDISLTVTSPDGCVGSLTQNQYICVFPYPIADFEFGPQPADILSPEIDFVNTSSGATIYNWDFAGLGTSTLINPSFVFPSDEPGNYNVCLVVENQHGCVDDICKIVVIDDYFTIYVPNAFTPDGDGVNDLFFALADGIDPTSFELMVFNRWGDLIFTTNDPNGTWDGTHRGQKSQQDVYVWKIKLKDAVEGKKHAFYGHVSLLR